MLPEYTAPEGGGLYVIWLSDTHFYGGRTTSFKIRWKNHLDRFLVGRHNRHAQAIFNKHGRFEPKVLEFMPSVVAIQKVAEQAWLDVHFGKPGCVNISNLAEGGSIKWTPERRAKAIANWHVTHSVDVSRASLAVNRLHITKEQYLKKGRTLGLSNKGRLLTTETRQKMSDSHQARYDNGYSLSEEARQSITEKAQQRFLEHPELWEHSEETKQLISQISTGRVWVNDGTQERFIQPEDIPSEGWVPGRIGGWDRKHTPLSGRQGGIWINNGVKNKRILEEELQAFLSSGWVEGQKPDRKADDIRTRSGRVQITNGLINKRVFPETLQSFLNDGWARGMAPK